MMRLFTRLRRYGLLQAREDGESVALDVGFDSAGQPTSSPGAILDGGAIRVFDRCARWASRHAHTCLQQYMYVPRRPGRPAARMMVVFGACAHGTACHWPDTEGASTPFCAGRTRAATWR